MFVQSVVRERNRGREKKLAQEQAVMRELPEGRHPEYELIEVRATSESMVTIGKHRYSVPSRYAGKELRAKVDEWSIEFAFRGKAVYRVPRQLGDRGVHVNWRHVLPQLVRKPGAFERWRHRESMYPAPEWKALHEELRKRFSAGRSEREYLGILLLAHEESYERVSEMVRTQSFELAIDSVKAALGKVAEVDSHNVITASFGAALTPELSSYDALISERGMECEPSKEVARG